MPSSKYRLKKADIKILKTYLSLFAAVLVGCGPEQGASETFLEMKEASNNQYHAPIVNGTDSCADCYDVGLPKINTSNGTISCTATRVSTGVFLTAAHCVVPTRPQVNPLPTIWNTNQINITFNPATNGRTYVNQIPSLRVIIPPNVNNYTATQWAGSPNYDMMATDAAIVVGVDTQAPWDKFSNPPFNKPALNSNANNVGYGYGSHNTSTGTLSDDGRRRYGLMQTNYISTSNTAGAGGVWTFYAAQGGFGTSGDSGGPFYAAPYGNQEYRTIVGILSSYYIVSVPTTGKDSNSAYNYSPDLSLLGGQQNYQWINNAIQQGVQIQKCLSSAYNNAISQCMP